MDGNQELVRIQPLLREPRTPGLTLCQRYGERRSTQRGVSKSSHEAEPVVRAMARGIANGDSVGEQERSTSVRVADSATDPGKEG